MRRSIRYSIGIAYGAGHLYNKPDNHRSIAGVESEIHEQRDDLLFQLLSGRKFQILRYDAYILKTGIRKTGKKGERKGSTMKKKTLFQERHTMHDVHRNSIEENVPLNTFTLRVVKDEQIIFQSEKHWIHPLLDLEAHISQNKLDLSNAEIYDKITGKAAALLILRIGIKVIHTHVISRLACEVFDQNSIAYSYTTLVERIDCKTEALLRDVHDPDQAHRILVELASQHTSGN
jgi:hypothetical protein